MKATDEKFLREKENKIRALISHGEIQFIRIFKFLHKYYELNNISGKIPTLSVFEAIYVKNLKLPAWKLAIYCNMSRTTLFNYRNTIVNDFYICVTENIISGDPDSTKGKK